MERRKRNEKEERRGEGKRKGTHEREEKVEMSADGKVGREREAVE